MQLFNKITYAATQKLNLFGRISGIYEKVLETQRILLSEKTTYKCLLTIQFC